MVSVRWLGAAGLEIERDGLVLLVDPYLSRPSKRRILFGRPSPDPEIVAAYLSRLPGEIAGIVVGHTHLDHALDIPEIARRFEGPILGSQSLENLLSASGVKGRVRICGGGERIAVREDISVCMIPSQHGLVFRGKAPYPGDIPPGIKLPMRANGYKHGTVFMPRIEIEGIAFLHAGSANFSEEHVRGHPCDVLFLCVPGWNKIDGLIPKLMELCRPKIVVPFHFDDFSARGAPDGSVPNAPFVDLEEFSRELSLRAPDLEIRWPRIFQTMRF